MFEVLDVLIIASCALSAVSVGAVAFWPAFRRRRSRPAASLPLSDPRRAGIE